MIKNYYYIIKSLLQKTLLLGVILITITKTSAQVADSTFNRVYNDIVSRMATDSIGIIQTSIDSLLEASTKEEQHARILLFKAIMSVRSGDKAAAIILASKAENKALKAKSSQWQVRSAGFLSSLYREVGLVNEGKKHIDIANMANASLKDSPSYYMIEFNIIGERAHYETHNENYGKAIELLLSRARLIDSLDTDVRPTFLLSNYRILGKNYLAIGDYQKAREMFKSGCDIVESLGMQSVEEIRLYRGMAEVEMHEQNYPAALRFLEKAKSLLSIDQGVEIQILVYKSIADYYAAVGMYEQSKKYNDLHLKNLNESRRQTEEIFNQVVQRSDQINLRNQNRVSYLRVFSGVAATSVVLLLVRVRLVRRKERRKYEVFIKKANQHNSLINGPGSNQVQADTSIDPSKGTLVMLAETKERILKDLNGLEKDLFFTNNDISLGSLARQLDTNTKYLSYVINTCKDKDFNNYINELRVRYIIEKLQTDPEYRQYKLAYIAQQAGFSSHSKFTSVFKSITGLSPSVFIGHLKKDTSDQRKTDKK